MTFIQKIQNKVDTFQQHSTFFGFVYAVIWKYGDDKTGYLAALLTYYGFLSLFPLLLLLTTITAMLASVFPHIQDRVIQSVTSYFPVIGNQLAEQIHGLHQNGWALFVGLLFLLYGTRGVASAFRYGVNRVWHSPKSDDLTFPRSTANNILVIIVGGGGLIAAGAITAAIAAQLSPSLRWVSLIADVFMLFWLFIALLKLSLPKHVVVKQVWTGAAIAAAGLVALQTGGGIYLTSHLKHLTALYSIFAISLGLLFWIYLQAQVIYFALQISAVHSKHLWPRTFTGDLIK